MDESIMKKIIIVGHNQENCEKLESLFYHFGMKHALPSRRENLTPIQIGELLNKVVKMQEQQQVEAQQDNIHQISTKKLPSHFNKRQAKKNSKKQSSSHIPVSIPKSTWDYIPMDLLIANIDNEFWGWADKNALDHLDYWKKIDPSILFVLTYDHPQSLLLELEGHELNIDKDVISEKLNDWNRYNTKMLEFLEKNPERVILVNNERVKQQNRNSIKTIYNQILPVELIEKNKANVVEIVEEQTIPLSSIETIIANNIISTYPETALLYEKLQQASNLPNLENSSNASLAFDALKEYNIRNNIFKERENDLVSKEKEITRLMDTLKFKESELESLVDVNKNISENFHKTSLEKNELDKQLQIVLEQLEKVSIEKQKIEKDKILSEKEKNEFLEGNKNLEIKLSLEKKDLLNQIKSISNENEQLLFQLHLVQEELEKLYMANKKLKEKPPIFGAADRIKNQLDYRIGTTLIRNSSNILGWFKIPFSLIKTYLDHKKWYRENNIELLPPIESYQDYHETHRLKKHLSYRLGQVFLSSIKNPLVWFVLPVRLCKEVKDFRKEKAI